MVYAWTYSMLIRLRAKSRKRWSQSCHKQREIHGHVPYLAPNRISMTYSSVAPANYRRCYSHAGSPLFQSSELVLEDLHSEPGPVTDALAERGREDAVGHHVQRRVGAAAYGAGVFVAIR